MGCRERMAPSLNFIRPSTLLPTLSSELGPIFVCLLMPGGWVHCNVVGAHGCPTRRPLQFCLLRFTLPVPAASVHCH